MRIDKLEIRNFRCFEHLIVEFHPRLNVFVGINGSGKTAILESLKLGIIGAIGEIKEVVPQKTTGSGYSFDPKKDPRLTVFERGEWVESDHVEIRLDGVLRNNDLPLSWSRILKKVNVRFSHVNYFDAIKPFFNTLYQAYQSNTDQEFPLFAYYSTGRLFLESNDTGVEINGKRIQGYVNASTAKSSQFLFKKWFEKSERGQGNYRRHGVKFDFSAFEKVKQVISGFIPGCKGIFFDETRFKEVVFVFDDGQILPYSMLSDGTRNLVAMASDLSLRAAVLNPWLGDKINTVGGVVLIDEVDLHLHPSWQRIVVPALLNAFPNVQFFITTHSPMTLAALEPHISDPQPNIFLLSNGNAEPLGRELFGTANNWLTEVFGLEEPRSIEAENVLRKAKKMLTEKVPKPEKVQSLSKDLMKYIQEHDTFWIRWNYFAQQHGVKL